MQKNNSRIQFIQSIIEDLIFKTTFDPKTGEGNVIVNISLIDESSLDEVSPIFKMVITSGLSVSPYIKMLYEGDVMGGMKIEKGKIGIATVCSITIDGILLKAGIPIRPKLGGIVQIKNGTPVRFTDVLTYSSTTIDPLEVLLSQDLTSVNQMLKTNTGNILANLREGPLAARDTIEHTLSDLVDTEFNGILEVSEPNTNILDVPVERDHLGIVVIGGTNSMAAIQEHGIPIHTNAMSTLIDINELSHITDVL